MSHTTQTKPTPQNATPKAPARRYAGAQRPPQPARDPKQPSTLKSGVCRAVSVLMCKSTGMPYSAQLNGDVGVSVDDMILGVGLHGIRQGTGRPFSRLGIYAMSADGHLHFVRTVEFGISTGEPIFRGERSGSDLDRALANWVSGALHNSNMIEGDYYPAFDMVNTGAAPEILEENPVYSELMLSKGVQARDFSLERSLSAKAQMVNEYTERATFGRPNPSKFGGLRRTFLYFEGQIPDSILNHPSALDALSVTSETFRQCAFMRFKMSIPRLKNADWSNPEVGAANNAQRAMQTMFLSMSEQVDEMWVNSFSVDMFETNFDSLQTNLFREVDHYLGACNELTGGQDQRFNKEICVDNAVMAVQSLRSLYLGRNDSGVTVWTVGSEAHKIEDQDMLERIEDLKKSPLFTLVAPDASAPIQIRTRFMSNGDFPFEGSDILPVS